MNKVRKANMNSSSNKIDEHLIDNLYNFLQQTKHDKLELKQDQNIIDQNDIYNIYDKEDDLQEYKRDYNTKIDKQLKIISNNIIDNLFNLNDQKYSAIISRLNIWGFQLTIQQFIINYYLVIKKDNRLRQFIMVHLQKIIKLLKILLQKQLIFNMKDFTFSDSRVKINIKKLEDKVKQNEEKLKEINPTNIIIKQTEDKGTITSDQDQANIEQQILNKLKQKHPKLEQEI